MIPTSPAAALVYHRSAELVYHKSAESRPAAGRMNYRDTDPSLTSSILSQSKWMHLHCIQRDFMACKHASMHGQLDMPNQCLSFLCSVFEGWGSLPSIKHATCNGMFSAVASGEHQ